jgi:hypothetical protein
VLDVDPVSGWETFRKKKWIFFPRKWTTEMSPSAFVALAITEMLLAGARLV